MGYVPIYPGGVESSHQTWTRTNFCAALKGKRAIHQEHIQQRPAESRERFEEIFEHAAVGMVLVDLNERIIEANRSMCDLLGYTEGELAGKTIRDITHPEDLDADLEQLNKLLGGEMRAYQMEKRYRHRNGHFVWGLLSRSLVCDEYGNPLYFISQIQDISERKALEEQLLLRAHHDYLTGLHNRAAFEEQIGRALSFGERNERSVALLFLDLDDFKRVNDTLGHGVGDRLLVEVANRLLGCVRAEDTVARIGGDEFCVLLEGLADADMASQAVERIKKCLEAPFVLGVHRLPQLTASIGAVVKSPGDRRTAGRMMEEADAAMYQAKRSAKARHNLYLGPVDGES